MRIRSAAASRWLFPQHGGTDADVVRVRQHGEVHLAMLANGHDSGFSSCWPPGSRLILDLFEEAWASSPGEDRERLRGAIERAREWFVAEAPSLIAGDADPEDEPAAVLLAVAVRGQRAEAGWIGANVAVHVRGGAVVATTTPHTLREHVREHPEQAEALAALPDVVMRWIGSRDRDPPGAASFALETGDAIVLLSRTSVSRLASPEEVASAVSAASPDEAAERLADASHAADAPYTAVAVLRFDDPR